MFFFKLKQTKFILSIFEVAAVTGSVLFLTLYARGSIKLSNNSLATNITQTDATSKTNLCPDSSGATANCMVDNSVLGAQVLGATTYGAMELVTIHYAGNLQNPDIKVNSVTYCGESMANITEGKTMIGTPQSGDSMRTEMWYKSLPKIGVCPVVVTFSGDPGQRVVSTTLFYNINSITPIAGSTYGTSIRNNPDEYNLPENFNINMSMSGPKDSLLICGYSILPDIIDGKGNNVTVRTGWINLWKFEDMKIGSNTAQVWGGLGTFTQRDTDNRFDSVIWKTTKGPRWSAICTNFNVKPFGSLNPTSAPTPTPTPNPTTVDLKVSNTNGPVTISYNGSVSLSWTSTLATSCTASGAWTGTKATAGSQVISGILASGTYTLTCNGVSDSVAVVVTPPTVDLKIGTSDGPVTIPYNGSFTLAWTTKLATACAASGAWTGAKVLNGSLAVTAVTTNRTYTLTCNGVTDSISVVVTQPTVDLKVAGSDGPVNIPYNGSFTLSWTTKLATACTATGSWTGAKLLNGSLLVSNVTANKTYTLTCNGVSDTISIVSLPPVISVDLKGNYSDGPIDLLWGDSVGLTWTTANVTSCTASNGWTGTKASYGTEYLYSLTTTKTYTITCGGKTDSVTVNVAPLPAPTVTGNISYQLITPITLSTTYTRGQVVTLTYKITEPDGTPGTPEEGFNTQTYVDNATQSVVGVNGVYNATTGYWTSTLTMPAVAGTYKYYSVGYCGRWKSGRYPCGYKYTTYQQQQSPNPSASIVVK